MGLEQVFGDDQAKHPVAQELEALVVAAPHLAAGMGERPAQQRPVPEAVTQPVGNLVVMRGGEADQRIRSG